jgi:hypothetical protein
MVETGADAAGEASRAGFVRSHFIYKPVIAGTREGSIVLFRTMRLLVIWSAVAVLAAGVCDAALAEVPVLLRTAGAEGINLSRGNGRAVVTGRGVLLVDMASGRLRIVDLPGPGQPNVPEPCRDRARRVSATTIQIRGGHISCRVWSGSGGGRWQVIMKGRSISAGGVVRGSVTLDAAESRRRGTYRVGDGRWRRWPFEARTIGLRR